MEKVKILNSLRKKESYAEIAKTYSKNVFAVYETVREKEAISLAVTSQTVKATATVPKCLAKVEKLSSLCMSVLEKTWYIWGSVLSLTSGIQGSFGMWHSQLRILL